MHLMNLAVCSVCEYRVGCFQLGVAHTCGSDTCVQVCPPKNTPFVLVTCSECLDNLLDMFDDNIIH